MRIFHLIFCLAFGFLGAHRFIVRQKMHGLVFLLLSIFTILFIGNPATEYIADISLKVLLVLIAIDAVTVLLTGRYIAFESNKKAENNDTKSRGEALDTDSLQHKIMCVRISKSIKQGLNVYDAARYAWKVSEQSISDVDFVLGVDDGIVVGVFKPNTWLPGDHPDFQSLNGFSNQYSDRFGFNGKDADKKVKNLYLNKTIQEMTGKQSGQNPVRFFGSTNNTVNQVNVQKTSNETGIPRSVPKAQTSNPSAPKTLVLIAYEINAETAKKLILKGLGISANLKKFNSSEIIEHVASAWSSIEELMYEQGISPLHKILYTAKLSDPLRIGQSRNDIINNSFLMSVISDNSMFGRQAIDGARFYDFSKHSDFEKKQLSIFLDEIGDRFSAQEIGIFCWIEIEKDLADSVVKQIASHFAPEKNGELHFLEFTHDGRILPNFANVSTQKFEGKLAGNFTLSLSQEEYQEGMDRLNKITDTVVGSLVFDAASEQPSRAELGSEEEKVVKTKNSYSDDFKRQVALAANQEGATLASVGQQFDVSPTLVRNWKNKFSESTAEIQIQNTSNSNVSTNDVQNWLQSSQVEGTIDGDGDLYVSLELSEEIITDKPKKLYLTGSQKLASGGKSETFDFESEVTANESNWLRSDYLNGVDKDDPSFALNMKLACHVCSDLLTIPITVKEGKIGDFPNEIGNIQVPELSIILEDGDYRLEGRLDGENGFIYGIEASTEEPDSEQSPRAAKVVDDENTAEIYEFLWDVKKGDTVYLQLASYAKLDGEIAISFTGKAEVQEPVVYDDDEDLDEDFDRPAVEDIETQEGDIGLFEFQIKRGYVDEEAIEDDEVKELVSDLKGLCESEDFEAATKLLMPSLSFEFGPNELDDEPEKYFSDLDYIEFECTNENTSAKVGVDGEGDLLVTITVQFEIALNAGISTRELEEYLPDSGAWAAASASPGWGYYESDGENVRFLGLKGEGGSNNHGSTSQSEYSPDNFEGTVHAITIKRSDQISDFGCLSASNHSMDGPELSIYLVNDFNTEDYHLILEGESYYLASVEEFDWEAPKYALSKIQKKLQQTFSINDEQAEQLIFYIQANVTDEADDLDAAHFTHFIAECGEVNGEDHFKDEKDAGNRIWISTGQNLSGIDVKIDAENFSIQFDHEFLEEKEVASWSKFKLIADIVPVHEMEEGENSDQSSKSGVINNLSVHDVQNWLQSSQVEGTIDGDGDLYVSLELSEEIITDKPKKLYLTGSQKLASGGKSETFDFESEVTANESNWLRSDYLNGVDKDDPSFALNMKLACHVCSDLLTIPITVKEGKIGDFPNEIGNIQVPELSIILEDGDYRLEGRLDGENGFIYGIEASTEEPDSEQSPRAAKVVDDENTAEIYEFLWDVKKGDTVYLQLASYAKLDGEIAISFTGKAEVQEPVVYDDDEDLDEDFDRPAVEDIETQEGDIGLFEFQIKRGYVDEEAIEDDEVKELVSDLKGLCESEDFEAATKLLMPSLSFEFGPNELDDEPEKYFSDLDYIEFECTNENTSAKVGVDGEGDLLVTITVQFEIALNAGISTRELEEYLPDSGAWAAASASPGWGYYESDGENVRFLGLKGEGGSSDALSDENGSKFWPPADDSRSFSDPKGCALYLKGAGYEFSASRLNHEDVLEMMRLADEDIDAFLSGGRLAENAGVGYEGQLVDLKYGLDPLDASFRWEDFPKEDDPTVDDENCVQVEFVADPTPVKEVVDYFNVAEGKVFGSISIPINHPSEFDPEKLRIEYFEFSLDGYPEQFGRIIEKIEYDGWQIEFEWEDNGLDVNTFLIGYELDDEGELEDHLVIHNSHGGGNFDFDWKLANKIFSSQTISKPKSIMDLSSQPIGSMEFKIEVASACAESGMNYKDFAKLYNLNADELNAWAIEFLGEGFE